VFAPRRRRGQQWRSEAALAPVENVARWVAEAFAAGLKRATITSIAAWAAEHVRLPGSARSERYDPSITPWCVPALETLLDDTVRTMTLCAPVQSGKSVVGEVAVCYWLANSAGDIFWNWANDGAADARWIKRIERTLLACQPVADLWPRERSKDTKGLVVFPVANLTVQGVWNDANLDSDSVRYLVNEEIHDWEPGRLAKAYNRTTAFWHAKILNISNAGNEGDQLHAAFRDGTQEAWEVRCPGCGEGHVMRTWFDRHHPEYGGIRYDSDACRRPNGEYDYAKLGPTIRYSWPCGHETPDELHARRALSLSGRYRARNPGAVGHRSFTLSAAAVDYIPWLQLVREKHAALRAMKRGDPEPFRRFRQERDSEFWKPEDRPTVDVVVTSPDRVKSRDGLVNRAVRFAAVDVQRGMVLTEGDHPHHWMVVRDFDALGNSLLVFEGRIETESDVTQSLRDLGVEPRHVLVDSGDGDTTTAVYRFCLSRGFHAVKGSSQAHFAHSDGSRRIFSEERPLCAMLGADPTHPDEPLAEPQFILYSKHGIRERLAWLRSSQEVKWEVPSDVSETYKHHLAAEERTERLHPRTNETVVEWVRLDRRNDLLACEAMIGLLAEMAGLIGAGVFAETVETEPA
jgi:hypothetical protein